MNYKLKQYYWYITTIIIYILENGNVFIIIKISISNMHIFKYYINGNKINKLIINIKMNKIKYKKYLLLII